MSFDQFLLESKAAEEAHKQGLSAAGYGLWRDKSGKVVKKTVDDKLVDVRGSEANLNHYHFDIPSNKVANHAAHDESVDIVNQHATVAAKTDSKANKYNITEHSQVHADKAFGLHEALVGAGYEHQPSAFGQIYTKGKTSVMISNRPEVAAKPGGKEKDHHTVVIRTDHVAKKKEKPKK